MVWNGSSVAEEISSMLSDENPLLERFRTGSRSQRKDIREFERILGDDD
jgi:hypothetical protein